MSPVVSPEASNRSRRTRKPVATPPAATVAAPKPKAAKAAKAEKAPKAQAKSPEKAAEKAPGKKEPPIVRDGFTMPASDFALIAQLKARALGAKRPAKKSELLRAGLHALVALDAKGLAAALDRLVPVKTGRPKRER